MLLRRFKDHLNLLLDGTGPEEEDHDEGVREAHFRAVDGAITDGFEEDERLLVLGVEDDALEGGLHGGTVSACDRRRGVLSAGEGYLQLLVRVGHGGLGVSTGDTKEDAIGTSGS